MNEYSFSTFGTVYFTSLSSLGEGSITNREKSNDKYQRILEAAVKVFAKHGFFQATVSQIAGEAGVADGTIYRYFKNKDDILIQFFSYKTKEVFSSLKEEVNTADNAIGKLRIFVRRHLEEFQQNRDMALVYQAETHRHASLAEKQIKEMAKMYLDLVSEIIEQGQEEGSLRKDLYLGLAKHFIFGGIDGVINTWLHSSGKYSLVSMADPLVELYINGIGNNS